MLNGQLDMMNKTGSNIEFVYNMSATSSTKQDQVLDLCTIFMLATSLRSLTFNSHVQNPR